MAFFKRPWRPNPEPTAAQVIRADALSEASPTSKPRPALTATARDFSVFEHDGAILKLWIPERLDEVLTHLEAHLGASRNSLLRMALFHYLYGRYDYVAMQVQEQGFFAPEGDSPMFSRGHSRGPRGGRMPEMRKNYKDVKVRLPQVMKDDLQASAQRFNLPLSLHVREILVSQLLGHLALPDRRQMLDEPADYAAAALEYERAMERWMNGEED